MPAILDQFGRPIRTRKSRSRWQELLARYDAAQTTDENMRHWQYVDGLSADAANSPEVRRTLRNRARYETANNCYARGIADTLAGDVIGTGPRLQVLTGNKDIDALVERRFHQWAKKVKLAKKLRTMRKSKCVDGEAFALLVTNNRLTTPVKLDLRLIEADQVTTPTLKPLGPNAVDRIRFDEDDNPMETALRLNGYAGELTGCGVSPYTCMPGAYFAGGFRWEASVRRFTSLRLQRSVAILRGVVHSHAAIERGSNG